MSVKLQKHHGHWFTRIGEGPTWKHSDLDTAIRYLQSLTGLA